MFEQEAPIVIADLDFDQLNIQHLARHDVTPGIVWEVLIDSPVFFENRPEQTASHLMIGSDVKGKKWTIAIVLIDDDDWIWRPITGWESDKSEREAWFVRN